MTCDPYDVTDEEAVPRYPDLWDDQPYEWSYRVIRESVTDPDVLVVALGKEPFKTRAAMEEEGDDE